MSLARILGKSRGRQSFISDSRWVLPTSFIGLEHEYEGVKENSLPKHTFADFWTQHEEGSLKDSGAEYVFATPMFGIDAYNAIEWLVAHAKASKWKCTKRTGIHVHLDVRDLEAPQLAGLSIIYAAVEPILYHWVGDGRDASHFCIPLYRADEALLGACSIIRSALQDAKDDGRTALGLAEEYQRYAGFNLQALHKFGSIEFRQLQTTHDLDRIVDWINIIMSLKATALKLPQSDGAVVRMIQRMGVQELLSYVFPSQIAAKLYTPKSEEEFISRGLPSARDIAVHGCGNAVWIKKDFPKGEHKGFIKWLKAAKEGPKRDYYDDVTEAEDGPDEDGDNIPVEPPPQRLGEDPFPRPFDDPVPVFGANLVPNWAMNVVPEHRLFQPVQEEPQAQVIAAEVQPAPPPIAPPPPILRQRGYEALMRLERERVAQANRRAFDVVMVPPRIRR